MLNKKYFLVILSLFLVSFLCSCELDSSDFNWSYNENYHWDETVSSVFGEKLAYVEHVWDKERVYKAPTCVEEGAKRKYCVICGYLKIEVIEPTYEHSFKTVKRNDPTCTEEGYHLQRCTLCGLEKNNILAVRGHTRSKQYFDDTYHYWECVCGKLMYSAKHAFGDPFITKFPTEFTEGEQKKDCVACGYEVYEVIPALHKHNWVNEVITKPSSCLEEGVMTYTCDGCNKIKEVSIPRHDFDEGVIIGHNSCIMNSFVMHSCRNCEEVKYSSIPGLDAHTGTFDNGAWSCCGSNDPETRPVTELIREPIIHDVSDFNPEGFSFDITGNDNWEVVIKLLNEKNSYTSENVRNHAWVMGIYSNPSNGELYSQGGWTVTADGLGWGDWSNYSVYDELDMNDPWFENFCEASSNMNVLLKIKYDSVNKSIKIDITYDSNISPYDEEIKTLTHECKNINYTGKMRVDIGASQSKVTIQSIKVFEGNVIWQSNN